MNLFEKIRELQNKDISVVTNIMKEYFTGHEVIPNWFDMNIDIEKLVIGYGVKIDGDKNDADEHIVDVDIYYSDMLSVLVSSNYKAFDGTVIGYLEQTIKRELTNKSHLLSEDEQ